ncbi:MAG: Na(+)/H(+) antiporter NhaA, partial [Chitinophagia bacterium]|nr:Na(+)/H(+) antiporter NhaA [Chitinophagia bacterium]
MRVIKQAFSPIKEFIRDSRFVGILLLISTALALFIAQSNYYPFINNVLHHSIITGTYLPNSLTEWISDFLMVFYFLLVGLEIKRALLVGELKNKKTALTPIIAAVGGMLVPGLIYYTITKQTPFSNDWGIP